MALGDAQVREELEMQDKYEYEYDFDTEQLDKSDSVA